MATSPALESLFATAEQKAADLLENLTAAINSKVTTIEEGEALVQKLSEEAARFNQILVTLDNTKAQVESGDITREQGLGIVEPLVKELKSNCVALSMCGVSFSDSDDIDVEEIAVLREIIAGAKNAAEARVVALRTHADLSPDTESMGVLEAFNSADAANETLTDARKYLSLRNSTEAKNAKLLADNARKLYSMGSKDKANEYMAKAKSLYQKCLDEAKKSAKWIKVERTETSATKQSSISDKYTKTVTDDLTDAAIVTYFEDRVDSCEAYLRQWKNKAGNVDLKATKAALKAERKAERDAKRAEKKAAKDAAKGANESMNPVDMTQGLDNESLKLVDALEAYASQCDSEILTMALEADGEAASTSSAVASYKSGDISEASKQINDALDTASSENKKGNPKKAIAIAVGVTASILAIVVIAGRVKTGKWQFPTQLAKEAVQHHKDAKAAKAKENPTTAEANGLIAKIKAFWSKVFGSAKKATDEIKALPPGHSIGKATPTKDDKYGIDNDSMVVSRGGDGPIGEESFKGLDPEMSSLIDVSLEALAMEYNDFLAACEGDATSVNYDAKTIKRKYAREMSDYVKAAKQAYASGNYSVAKANYLKAASICDAIIKEIKALPEGTSAQTHIGNFLYALKGGFVGIGEGTKLDQVIRQWNSVGKGELDRNTQNKYIQEIISWASDLKKEYITMANKAGKGANPAKESVGADADLAAAMDNGIDAAFEALDVEYNDFLAACEGDATSVNYDAKTIKKTYARDIRDLAKAAKQAYKAGNFAVAKKNYEAAAGLCDKIIDEVKSLPEGTSAQTQVGNLLYALKSLLIGYANQGNQMDQVIRQWNAVGKGELDRNALNKYVQQIISWASELKSKYLSLAEKAGKGAKPTTESTGLEGVLASLGLTSATESDAIDALAAAWAKADGIEI